MTRTGRRSMLVVIALLPGCAASEWVEPNSGMVGRFEVTQAEIPAADRAQVGDGVSRGGSWYFGADSAACGLRYTHRPQDRGFSVGFRLVRED